MLLKELITLLDDEISPQTYSSEKEFHGIQYGTFKENKPIHKILITIDLNKKAIHHAVVKKYNLIISFNPLLREPILKFNSNLINKLNLLSNYPMIIYILNAAFYMGSYGIFDTIQNVLYLEIEDLLETTTNEISVNLGIVCKPKFYPDQEKPFLLLNLLSRIKNVISSEKIRFIGNLKCEIEKICIIRGKTINSKILNELEEIGCNCIISDQLDYQEASYLNDIGMTFLEFPRYYSTTISLKKLTNYLSLHFPREEFTYFDSENPFKTLSK
ncbi:MAG: hypothetical protein GF353_28295 [Candidatus Lokiarchaeota archaeon]|nr:hypothetical protein [Candidatus Lokiarchaeota archaeon]